MEETLGVIRVTAHYALMITSISLAFGAYIAAVPWRWLAVAGCLAMAAWFSLLIITARTGGIIDRADALPYLTLTETLAAILSISWIALVVLRASRQRTRRELSRKEN